MSSALSCPDCGTPHTVDQRYCVECGHRVRPLPATVANALAVMAGERRIGADRLNRTPAGTAGASTSTRPGLTLFGSPLELPSPRAMVVAVLAVLAFGVIISSGNFSLANSPLLVLVHRAEAPAATTSLALASGGSGSVPAASGGSTSSGGSSAAPSSGASTSTPSTSTGTSTTPASAAGLPPIKHVWVIELGDQGYASTFDRGSPDTYLNTTLASQGQVVPQVYASATSDLANEVGLVSGQGPTVQTEADCPKYTALKPGTLAGTQVKGSGCVYPKSTPSMMSELTAAHDTWKAYVQGLGTTVKAGCEHPGLGAQDSHFTATGANSYVTWRNPVVYLAGLTSLKSCGSDDTGLAALTTDLKSTAATPNVSFIFPNSCDDGSDTPCRPGAPAGTKPSDRFLKSIVPQIMASPAYKADGMILITFAESPQDVATPDQSSCCDQPTQYPNLPSADYEPPTTGTGTSTTGTGTATTGTGTTGTATTGTGTSTTGTDTTGTGTSTAGAATATGAESANDTAARSADTGARSADDTAARSADDTGATTTATTAASPYTEAPVPAASTVPTTATAPPATTETGVAATCVPATTSTDTTTTGTDTTTTGTSTGTPATAATATTGTDTTGTDTTATTTTCVCPTTTDTTATGTETSTTGTSTTATDTTGTDTTAADETCVCPATTDTTTTSTTTASTGTGTTTTPASGATCVCPSTTDTTVTTTGTTTTGTTTGGTDTTGTPGDVVECEPEPLATSGTTGGGGQVGMLVLSQYVSKNLQDGEDMFNTFSITASLEQLFGLKYTGYAATAGLPLFSGFFYSNYNSG